MSIKNYKQKTPYNKGVYKMIIKKLTTFLEN